MHKLRCLIIYFLIWLFWLLNGINRFLVRCLIIIQLTERLLLTTFWCSLSWFIIIWVIKLINKSRLVFIVVASLKWKWSATCSSRGCRRCLLKRKWRWFTIKTRVLIFLRQIWFILEYVPSFNLTSNAVNQHKYDIVHCSYEPLPKSLLHSMHYRYYVRQKLYNFILTSCMLIKFASFVHGSM